MKPSSAMPAYQEIIDALRSAVSDTRASSPIPPTSPPLLWTAEDADKAKRLPSCAPPQPKRFLSS